MRSLEKSPWRLRSPANPGWVFSFASGPLPPATGRAVVQKKEARATRKGSPPDSIRFMNACLHPSRLKRRLAGLTPEPFPGGRSTTSPFYLLQNRHRAGFSRFAIWLRHFGSMLLGRYAKCLSNGKSSSFGLL